MNFKSIQIVEFQSLSISEAMERLSGKRIGERMKAKTAGEDSKDLIQTLILYVGKQSLSEFYEMVS